VDSDLDSEGKAELETVEELASIEGISAEFPADSGLIGSVESLEIGDTSAGFA
jgi:hypothetical protein